MKINKLVINNIASFCNAEIDFSVAPLSDSKLFLICGNTGSGKTTILDAICLALYKDAPRLQRIDENESKNTDTDVLPNRDARQLMRQGTVKASVRLTFTGNDGHDYEAEWEVHRAGNKTDGKLQAVRWSWHDTANNFTATKDADINELISKAIGLSYEQFCRTCLLAQGEFSRFLFAKEKEKADILEKLTNTEKYTQIGRRVFEKCNDVKNQYEHLKSAIADIQLLDNEQVNEYSQRRDELQATVAKQKTEIQSLGEKLHWLSQSAVLNKKHTDLRAALQLLHDKSASPQCQSDRSLVADWEGTVDARRLYKTLHDHQNELTKLSQSMDIVAQQFSKLLGQEADMTAKVEQKKSYLRECEDFVAAQAADKQMFAEADTIAKQLADYRKETENQKQAAINIKVSEKKLAELQAAVEAAKSEKATLEAANAAKQAEIDDRKHALTGKNKPKMEADYRAAQQSERAVTDALRLLDDYAKEQSQLQTIEQKLTDYSEKLQAAQAHGVELEQSVTTAQEAYNQADSLYEKAKDGVSDIVKELRHKLQLGDCCPVCGQKIDHQLVDDDFRSALEPLLQNREAAKQSLTEKTKLYDDNVVTIKSLRNYHNAENERKAIVEKNIAERFKQVSDRCNTLNINVLDNSLQSVLHDRQTAVAAEIATLSAGLTDCQKLQNEIDSLQTKKDEMQNSVNRAQQKLTSNERSLSDCSVEKEKVRGQLDSARQHADALYADLQQHRLPENWLAEFEQEPQQYIANLKTRAKAYLDKVETIRRLTNELTTQDAEIQQIASTKTDILTSVPQWATLPVRPMQLLPNLPKQWVDLKDKVRELTIRKTSLEQAKELTSNELADFYRQSSITEARLAELLKHSDDEIGRKRVALQALQRETDDKNSQLKAAEADIQEHLAKRPPMSETDTEPTLQQQIKELNETLSQHLENIGKIAQILETNALRVTEYADKKQVFDRLRTELEAWQKLNNKIGDKEGRTIKTFIQGYVIAQMLYNANYYLQKFNKRYKLLSNGLLLRVSDNFAGGSPRGVTSLSGGESFIVSLALALGLSAIGREQVVETLFIDEGFATLSSDYLNAVITALNTINDVSRRKVGIISHVECLRKEIPTHIEVRKDGEFAPGIIKVTR